MRIPFFGPALVAACFLSVSPVGASTILVSPLSFDFGDVYNDTTASSQTVTITNVTDETQTISLAGGAAGDFGGATNCSGSLSPGESCIISYAYSPDSLGSSSQTTTLSVNGETYTFSFEGNSIDPILVSPTSFDFGSVPTGTTSDPQTVTLTNVSDETQTVALAGGAAGDFGGATSCGTTLAPGESCTISYAFTPTADGDASGTTTLSVNGENYTFSFEGSGGAADAEPLLISPRSFDFGDVYRNETATPQTVTITNVSGSTQTLSLAGGAAGDFGGATSCGTTLAPGASCTISYAFTPTADGDASGTTTLSVNGETYTFAFEGSGLYPFLVSPLSFDFGEVEIGTTSDSQFVDILNLSGVLQELGLAGGAAGVFGGATNCGTSVAALASCYVSYAFTPDALGFFSQTTSLLVGGVLHTFTFKGVGVGPDGEDGMPTVPVSPTLPLLGGGLFLLAGLRKRKAPGRN